MLSPIGQESYVRTYAPVAPPGISNPRASQEGLFPLRVISDDLIRRYALATPTSI